MSIRTKYRWQAFGLLVIFILESMYGALLLIQSEDPDTILTVAEVPVVGDWYYRKHTADARGRAETGDVSSMIYLYNEALYLGRENDASKALSMIRTVDSPTAELFLYMLEGDSHPDSDPVKEERNLLLLQAQAMRENLRPPVPDMTGEVYVRQSHRNAEALAVLLKNAQNGDETATWIIQNLYSR